MSRSYTQILEWTRMKLKLFARRIGWQNDLVAFSLCLELKASPTCTEQVEEHKA
jgi:hypothetical protein